MTSVTKIENLKISPVVMTILMTVVMGYDHLLDLKLVDLPMLKREHFKPRQNRFINA